MTQTRPRLEFRPTVERELRRRGWGHRTLARKIAGEGATAERIEVARKNIRRWLIQGTQPSRAHRRRVAAALELPENAFEDDEEEEGSLEAILQREVVLATQRANRKWAKRQAARQEVEQDGVRV